MLVVSRLLPAAEEELARLHMPVVLVDPVGSGDQAFATVAATDWAGGRDAAEHLIGLGHRRIAMITGPIDQACHQDRLDGYRTALRRAGIPYDEALVRYGDSLIGGGHRNGLDLLRSAEPPTAIISGSDEQAYGVYQAARECGLRIPKDVSVVGFDGLDLPWFKPDVLTSVAQPLAEKGRAVGREVARLLEGEPPQSLDLPVELVWGTTAGPAPTV